MMLSDNATRRARARCGCAPATRDGFLRSELGSAGLAVGVSTPVGSVGAELHASPGFAVRTGFELRAHALDLAAAKARVLAASARAVVAGPSSSLLVRPLASPTVNVPQVSGPPVVGVVPSLASTPARAPTQEVPTVGRSPAADPTSSTPGRTSTAFSLSALPPGLKVLTVSPSVSPAPAVTVRTVVPPPRSGVVVPSIRSGTTDPTGPTSVGVGTLGAGGGQPVVGVLAGAPGVVPNIQTSPGNAAAPIADHCRQFPVDAPQAAQHGGTVAVENDPNNHLSTLFYADGVAVRFDTNTCQFTVGTSGTRPEPGAPGGIARTFIPTLTTAAPPPIVLGPPGSGVGTAGLSTSVMLVLVLGAVGIAYALSR